MKNGQSQQQRQPGIPEVPEPDPATSKDQLRIELVKELTAIGFDRTHTFASEFMQHYWLSSIFEPHRSFDEKDEIADNRALLTKLFNLAGTKLNKHHLPIECYVNKLVPDQNIFSHETIAAEAIKIVNIHIREHLIAQEAAKSSSNA